MAAADAAASAAQEVAVAEKAGLDAVHAAIATAEEAAARADDAPPCPASRPFA